MSGTLYIVATPVGNAEDITKRAARVLAEADIIAAEDTRSAMRLLNILNLTGKVVSNHKFNEKHRADALIDALSEGKDVAVISDAGTPCIQDPGGALVKAAAARGIKTAAVCGASSVTAALSVSGFEFGSFAFYGFLPKTENQIKKAFDTAIQSGIDAFVFFESPKRIIKTMRILKDMAADAEVCLCNDLTKLHERIYRGTPAEVSDELAGNPNAEKGEYTLVIKFAGKPAEAAEQLSPEALIADYMAKNGVNTKDAVSALCKTHKGRVTRTELYDAALRLKAVFAGG